MRAGLGDTDQPFAIVIGLDGMNGLQAARILAARRVPVIAIAQDPKGRPSRTRVCEEILFADTENEGFLEVLEALGPRLKHKAVLFPCNDMNVAIISRHRHELQKWYHVILPPHDVVDMLMNKVSFYAYARQQGIPTPRTFVLQNIADAEQAAREMRFPCILKPQVRSTEWHEHSRFKAYKILGADQLLSTYNRYHQWARALVAQEWIEGPDANLYSCNCYFNTASEPVVTFVARKIRQWPPQTGKSCLGVECRNDLVLDTAIRLFRSVNYRGLGYLEMKRDERSGEYFAVEPNIGRPTGRSTIAEAGGVELLYTMYCDAVGWPLPANREQKYTGVKWIYLRRDFQSAFYYWRRGELSLMDWWRSIRGRKTYALFSWTDPGPFLADLLKVVRVYSKPESLRLALKVESEGSVLR